MWQYYALVLIPILFGHIKIKYTNRSLDSERTAREPSIVIFFSILILLLSLRNAECGADTKVYEYYFNFASSHTFRQLLNSSDYLSMRNSVEVGYLLLNKLVCIVSNNNYQIFITVTAIVSMVPVCWFYLRESEDDIFVIALFMTLVPVTTLFSMIRQVIAMAFAIPAYCFTRKKMLIKFIIIILLASTFHKSAIIMLVLYPVYWAKYEPKTLYVFLPIIAAVFVFNQQIFTVLSGFLGERYTSLYGSTTTTGAFGMLALFFLITVYCFCIADETLLTEEERGMRSILILIVLLQCFAPIHTIAMRMTNYFQYFIPIIVAKILLKPKAKFYQIAIASKYVLGIFCVVYFFYQAYYGADILNVFPYVPFWEI